MSHGEDRSTSPNEKMNRKCSRRRWSDSPTLLQNVNLQTAHDLTQSLHDLSEPILQPVSKLSSVSQNNLSTSTIQSGLGVRTKSQDSGFNKSASNLSFHSTSHKYSHVESRVKKYVQGIKDSEALRKKSLSNNSVNHFALPSSVKEKKPVVQPGQNVEEYIEKLQSDLQDKDALLKALQGSYEDLLYKHAEAENKIDQLRLKSLENSSPWSRRSRHSFLDHFESQRNHGREKILMDSKTSCFYDKSKLPLPKEQHDGSYEFEGSLSPSVSESILLTPSPQSEQEKIDTEIVSPKKVVISAPLGPIQKLYSTSVRLDRILQPLSPRSPKSCELKSSQPFYDNSSPPQAPGTIESQAEEKETADGQSNNLYHMTTDTGIEDCIQSATDKDTENENKKTHGRLPIGSELQRIPNFPNEDAISKVQRWRNSLPNNIRDKRLEFTTKLKKTRNRKPALPKKNIGIQTNNQSENVPCLCSEEPSLCLCNSSNSSALVKFADTSDNDYAESLAETDCDKYSDIDHRNAQKLSWSSNVTHLRKIQAFPRSRSVESLNRYRCCGKCKTCGSAIVADAATALPSLSTSYCSPKERSQESFHRKLRSGVDRSDKIRRESPCLKKSGRCSRVSGTQVTRAVLLDLLLNVQSSHSCCCCCQHSWRARQLPSPVLKEGPNQEKVAENALQQCLAEIQKIAWDLNEKLAQSHAGLVNLSCRKKD